MVTIAVMNQKGGVGKSTVTRNFGAFLASQGYRTLIIDVDTQSNLSKISKVRLWMLSVTNTMSIC